MEKKEEIKLGDKVRDKITGFEGIAISRIEYMNGCVQYGVKAKMCEGKLLDAEYIDAGQLILVKSKAGEEKTKLTEKEPIRRSGGVHSDEPRRTSHPRQSYYQARKRN